MTKNRDVPTATLGDRLHTLAKARIASISGVSSVDFLWTCFQSAPVNKKTYTNRVYQMEYQR